MKQNPKTEPSTLKPIRLIIVDDHPIVRAGLIMSLSIAPDLQVVGEADNGEKAIELCARLVPDVVLMDLAMPGIGGVAATQALRRQNPCIQVVILTSFEEDTLVQQALKAGAIGFLLKNVSVTALTEAIRAAASGRVSLSPEAAQALVRSTIQPLPQDYNLTRREKEILSLLAQGLTNAEIGRRLFISETTARYHVSNLFTKLRVSNRTEAALLAREQKLVD